MQKKTILTFSLFFLQCLIYAQVTNYQIANGDFELWETFTLNNQSVTEPVHWNSFKTGWAPAGSTLEFAMQLLPSQIKESSDVRPGSTGQKSIKTWSLDLSFYSQGLIANGMFTTGQIHMNTASHWDPDNYYGTLIDNANFNQPLTTMPDSIYFWAKYKTPTSTQNAACHAYIHDNSDVHDPVPTTMNANIVASAIAEWPRNNQQWEQHKIAFDYASWTNQNPAYILITFFTSPTWGSGTPNDTLYVDDIELIYCKLLDNLQVNGSPIPNFNPQNTNYSVSFCQPFTAENIPVVSATAVSSHATVTITQPTLENLTATIIVTNGGSSKTYTVHFNNNSSYSEHNAQLCQGYPYNGYGFNISNPTTQQYSRTIVGGNMYGCDSTIYLNLTVFESYTGTQSIPIYDTTCAGAGYNNHGFVLTPAETITSETTLFKTHNSLTTNGCDSTTILALYINPKHNIQISDRVCQGVAYQQYGFNIPASTLSHVGTHTSTLNLTNRFHCDSTVTLQLAIDSIYHTILYDQICYGETYTNHGFNVPDNLSVGTHSYEQNLFSTKNCDSLVSLLLTVNPVQITSLSDTICQNSVYQKYGFGFSADQTTMVGIKQATLSLQTEQGCDSIVMLNLLINPIKQTHIYDTICANYDYQQYGFDIHATGSGTKLYTQSLQTENQCDSTVTLHLFIHPAYNPAPLYFKLCGSSTYNFYGQILDANGTYTHTLSSKNGCDSVITLHLETGNEFRHVISADICEGETYNLHGFSKSTSGLDSIIYTAINGCDSVVVLELAVHPLSADTITINTCDNYFWENTNYTLSGIYTKYYNSQYGCDSTKTLQLTLNYSSPITHFIDTVRGGYIYNNHGFIIYAPQISNTILDTLYLTNATNCDSIITLRLHVIPMIYDTAYNYYCQGNGYIWKGTTYYEAQNFTDTLFEVNSTRIVTTRFIENETPESEFSISDCNPYVWDDTICSTTGNYTKVYPLSTGCDSTVTLHFTRLIAYAFEENYTMCNNEGIYEWHGQQYTTSGTYYDSLSTSYGCDSIYQLNLTVNSTYLIPYQHVFCDNIMYSWRGQSITETRTYWDSLTTIHGCDSIYQLEAIVNSTYLFIKDTTICETETPLIWHGETYTESGIFTKPYYSISGCDSTYKLNLTVLPIITIDSAMTICEGESIIWGDEIADTTGVYIKYLANTWHCDTICRLLLSVNPISNIDLYYTAAIGDTLNYEGFLLFGDSMAEAGQYILELVLTNQYGCDSIVNLHLTVSGIADTENLNILIYPNPASNHFTIENLQGMIKEVAIFDLAGKIIEKIHARDNKVSIPVNHWTRGIYIIKIDTGNAILIRKFVVN